MTGAADAWLDALAQALRRENVPRWTCAAGVVLPGLGLALMRWQGQR